MEVTRNNYKSEEFRREFNHIIRNNGFPRAVIFYGEEIDRFIILLNSDRDISEEEGERVASELHEAGLRFAFNVVMIDGENPEDPQYTAEFEISELEVRRFEYTEESDDDDSPVLVAPPNSPVSEEGGITIDDETARALGIEVRVDGGSGGGAGGGASGEDARSYETIPGDITHYSE